MRRQCRLSLYLWLIVWELLLVICSNYITVEWIVWYWNSQFGSRWMTSTALPADWLMGSPGRRRCSTWLNQDLPPQLLLTSPVCVCTTERRIHLLKYTNPPLPFYYYYFFSQLLWTIVNLSNVSNNCTMVTFKVFHLECFFFKWLPSAIPDCIVMCSVLYIHCYVNLSLRNIGYVFT